MQDSTSILCLHSTPYSILDRMLRPNYESSVLVPSCSVPKKTKFSLASLRYFNGSSPTEAILASFCQCLGECETELDQIGQGLQFLTARLDAQQSLMSSTPGRLCRTSPVPPREGLLPSGNPVTETIQVLTLDPGHPRGWLCPHYSCWSPMHPRGDSARIMAARTLGISNLYFLRSLEDTG